MARSLPLSEGRSRSRFHFVHTFLLPKVIRCRTETRCYFPQARCTRTTSATGGHTRSIEKLSFFATNNNNNDCYCSRATGRDCWRKNCTWRESKSRAPTRQLNGCCVRTVKKTGRGSRLREPPQHGIWKQARPGPQTPHNDSSGGTGDHHLRVRRWSQAWCLIHRPRGKPCRPIDIKMRQHGQIAMPERSHRSNLGSAAKPPAPFLVLL